jgi:hypothetical protein
VAGLSVLGIPEWAIPALAQSETRALHRHTCRFSDGYGRRQAHHDVRKIDGPFTPKDRSSRRSITAILKSTRQRFA